MFKCPGPRASGGAAGPHGNATLNASRNLRPTRLPPAAAPSRILPTVQTRPVSPHPAQCWSSPVSLMVAVLMGKRGPSLSSELPPRCRVHTQPLVWGACAGPSADSLTQRPNAGRRTAPHPVDAGHFPAGRTQGAGLLGARPCRALPGWRILGLLPRQPWGAPTSPSPCEHSASAKPRLSQLRGGRGNSPFERAPPWLPADLSSPHLARHARLPFCELPARLPFLFYGFALQHHPPSVTETGKTGCF